jgi:hypothetical protein
MMNEKELSNHEEKQEKKSENIFICPYINTTVILCRVCGEMHIKPKKYLENIYKKDELEK